MRCDSLLLCASVLLVGTSLSPQNAGAIEGAVLNSATAQPMARAWVMLRAEFGKQSTATSITDAQGRFAFAGLSGGEYWIEARRDNFLRDGGNRVSLAAGEAKNDFVLKLTPLGVIAGHVRTEEGDPVPDLAITLMEYEYRQGGRQLVNKNSATTNDLGEYRFYGLLPGKYFIKTATHATLGVDVIYPVTYFPGATDPSGAAPLALGAGEELAGNDFALRLTRTARIRGRVIAPEAAERVNVSLTSNLGGVPLANTSPRDPQGSFEMYSVTPGAYTLSATANLGGSMYTARRDIQVGAVDVDGIELRLAAPLDVSGTLYIEGSASIRPSQVSIGLGPNGARVKDDGTFTFKGVAPDMYHPTFSGLGNLFVKAIRCGNTDVTENGLDLTAGVGCSLAVYLSANGAQIEGSVQVDDAHAAKAGPVTLVPVGTNRTDLFRSVWSDDVGHFKFEGVAPGSYRLYAWESVDPNAVRYDPDYVRPFESQGRNVRVAEGAHESITLKRIGKSANQ